MTPVKSSHDLHIPAFIGGEFFIVSFCPFCTSRSLYSSCESSGSCTWRSWSPWFHASAPFASSMALSTSELALPRFDFVLSAPVLDLSIRDRALLCSLLWLTGDKVTEKECMAVYMPSSLSIWLQNHWEIPTPYSYRQSRKTTQRGFNNFLTLVLDWKYDFVCQKSRIEWFSLDP